MDDPYNEQAWVRSIQAAVADIASRYQVSQPSIALVGLSKNGERYYPKRFPQWPSVEVSDDNGVRGSAIRQALFGGDDAAQAAAIGYLASAAAEQALPDAVRSQLLAYCDQPAFQQIHQQAAFIARYRSAWAEVPYPPTFVTVDGLVVQSGHILLVQRRAQPGKGLWALPGGFVRGAETLEDACIRELREETRLKVPEPVLRGSIQDRRVFDAPFRSERGRTITHVFRIQFTPNLALPKVRGGDDARHALWVPLSELKPEVMFEDHYFIVKTMIG